MIYQRIQRSSLFSAKSMVIMTLMHSHADEEVDDGLHLLPCLSVQHFRLSALPSHRKSSEISRHSMGNSVVHERGVSNHEGHRRISDVLDNTIWRGGYQSSSGTRALVHGVYHEHLANQKEQAGNYEGAAAERARAQQQHEVLERSNYWKAFEKAEESDKWVWS